MEFILIKHGSTEWNYMWEWLGNHPINEGYDEPTIAMNPTTGEAWQYMGSYKHNNKVISEFRHRDHPRTNSVQYLKVNGSETFNETDIHRTLK